jgi:hypothetical protein
VQGPEKEARLAALTGRIAEICGKRGVMIKPFFDDAAQDEKSGELDSVSAGSNIQGSVGAHLMPAVTLKQGLVGKHNHHDSYGRPCSCGSCSAVTR